jgi:hypothetical protein
MVARGVSPGKRTKKKTSPEGAAQPDNNRYHNEDIVFMAFMIGGAVDPGASTGRRRQVSTARWRDRPTRRYGNGIPLAKPPRTPRTTYDEQSN